MNRICHYFLLVACVSTISFAQDATPGRKYLSKENWSKLQDGDIVFIRSRSENASLIAQMANADAKDDADAVFTHCGIVFQEKSEWCVLEGAGRGKVLTLKEWQIEEAKDKNHPQGESPHHVYVRRWKASGELTTEKLVKLIDRAKTLHNTGYDWGFSWSDDFTYCSELIWKAYDAAGLVLPLNKIQSYLDRLPDEPTRQRALSKLNKTEVENKYRKGNEVNGQEEAVSPEDLYNSEKLVSVTD